jgi:hypothetical protein
MTGQFNVPRSVVIDETGDRGKCSILKILIVSFLSEITQAEHLVRVSEIRDERPSEI